MTQISVVIPFFNAPELCAGLVAHLQDFFESSGLACEFLVIDDGSEPGCAAQLNQYLERNEKVKVYRTQKNSGQYAAIAFGLSQCIGDTVIIADQDIPHISYKHLTDLIVKKNNYDLQYIYDDDQSHVRILRKYSSLVWHQIIKLIVKGKPIPGNPMPFRVVSRSLVDSLLQNDYVTSIIDIELLRYSKSIHFLKADDLDPDVHNVSKYSLVKLAWVIVLSLVNLSVILYKSLIGAFIILLLLTALIAPSVPLFITLSTTGVVAATITFLLNRRYTYSRQMKLIAPYIGPGKN